MFKKAKEPVHIFSLTRLGPEVLKGCITELKDLDGKGAQDSVMAEELLYRVLTFSPSSRLAAMVECQLDSFNLVSPKELWEPVVKEYLETEDPYADEGYLSISVSGEKCCVEVHDSYDEAFSVMTDYIVWCKDPKSFAKDIRKFASEDNDKLKSVKEKVEHYIQFLKMIEEVLEDEQVKVMFEGEDE